MKLPVLLSLFCSLSEMLKSTDHLLSLDVTVFYLLVACILQILCFMRLDFLSWVMVAPLCLWYLSTPVQALTRVIV